MWMNPDAAKELVHFMTTLAIKDLKNSIDTIRRLWMKRNCWEYKDAVRTMKQCEEYFRGPIFNLAYPNIDPEFIIQKVKSYDFQKPKRKDNWHL